MKCRVIRSTDKPRHTHLVVNPSGTAVPSKLPLAARAVAGILGLLIGSVTGSQVLAEEKSRVLHERTLPVSAATSDALGESFAIAPQPDVATVLPAKAETCSGQDRWQFGGSAYLWAAWVEGTSAADDEIDISFTDLLDSLDGGIMDILAARKGRRTLIGDILYLSIHEETS